MLQFLVIAAAVLGPVLHSPLANTGEEPLMLVTDRDVLSELEVHGLSLGAVLGVPAAKSTRALSEDTAFSSIAASITGEIKALLAEDDSAGTRLSDAHRAFDPAWLRAEHAHFELVAVANRMDRTPFERRYGRATSCGEVRLVYRLAYSVTLADGASLSSRLPMTLNVGFRLAADESGSCVPTATRWQVPRDRKGAALAQWLQREGGPLASDIIGPEQLVAVASNLQQVRWPSAVHQSFGGHSEYLLTRYAAAVSEGRLVLTRSRLENTPDLKRLKTSKSLRKELLRFLKKKENLEALDEGTLVIPEKFLATRSVSVAPHGLERKINRPWRLVLPPRRFKRVDLSWSRTIRSPEALVRRLDALSCAGCHQARSHAGFHALGADPADQTFAAMAVAVSPHVSFDVERRRTRHLSLLAGGPVDELQPTAERDGTRYGSHCGLPQPAGDDGERPEPDAELSTWTCGRDLKCVTAGGSDVGLCASRRGPRVGDPCDLGRIVSWADPRRDRAVDVTEIPCRGSRCVRASGGMPQGMCRAFCGASDQVACGIMPAGGPFNPCIAKGRPFTECIEQSQLRVGLRPCGPDQPCRDDYLCARAPDRVTGTCLPPYFLFQLRVDGHPEIR